MQLVETILKNVPGAVVIWGKRDFQETVVAAVCSTKFLRARESLLELVQALGIAYSSDKKVCFSQAYTELLTRHRISFPPPNKQGFVAPTERVMTGAAKSPRDEATRLRKSARKDHSLVDIYDPTGIFADEGVKGDYETVRSQPRRRHRPPKEASIEDQLDAVSSSISLLNDIIDNLGEGEKVMENELILEIVPSIQKTAETIIRIIQSDTDKDEELTARLFSANDAITEALERYEAAKRGKKLAPKIPVTKADKKVPSAPPKPVAPKVDDDPFDDEFTALAQRNRTPSTKTLSQVESGAPPRMVDLLGFGEPVASQPMLQPPPASASSPNLHPSAFTAVSPPAATNPFDMFAALSPSNSFASLSVSPPAMQPAFSGNNAFSAPAPQTAPFTWDFGQPLTPTPNTSNTSNTTQHSHSHSDSLI